MRVNRLLRFFITLFAILLIPTAMPGGASGSEKETIPQIVRVGFSTHILSDIDPRDAKAAMELWTKELTRSLGMKTLPQTVIFSNTAELLEAVNKGGFSFVSLPAIDYLKIRDSTHLFPALVAESHVGKPRELVLITRKDRGISSISDLRGKTISLLSPAKSEVSYLWLDVLLMREGKQGRSSFFRKVSETTSPSRAIMAVFFRQSDAAIINRGAFDLSITLNPQIGSQLDAVEESKPLMGDITCMPITVNEQMKSAYMQAALHLHTSTVGRQMFTLFQINRMIPFKSSYLDGTVDLLREHDKLQAKQKRKL